MLLLTAVHVCLMQPSLVVSLVSSYFLKIISRSSFQSAAQSVNVLLKLIPPLAKALTVNANGFAALSGFFILPIQSNPAPQPPPTVMKCCFSATVTTVNVFFPVVGFLSLALSSSCSLKRGSNADSRQQGRL